MARAPALHAGGHRFESDILHRERKQSKVTVYSVGIIIDMVREGAENRFESGVIDSEAKMLKQCEA